MKHSGFSDSLTRNPSGFLLGRQISPWFKKNYQVRVLPNFWSNSLNLTIPGKYIIGI